LVLDDGTPVLLRAVTASEAALVADAHALLCQHADRVHDLLTGPRAAGEVGRSRLHVDADAALVAVSPARQRGVGIARYRRDPHDPAVAEVAIGVVEEWRGRGLGRSLLTSLAARARARRIRRFTALTSVDDHAALALLRAVNAEVTVGYREFGVVRYEVALAQRFCNLCGRRTDLPETGSTANQVCSACLRRYLPKIQARLAEPWWR
jgi:GNAT superfamily N-acetyltransferase